MTLRAVLRGYLLEEALAWLLRNTGYRLLVDASQDPDELVMAGGTLLVQGRGTTHQVDVLGEFALTPAFSLPIRMFIEAKFYRERCKLPVVRNAHGVIHDINENFVHFGGSRPRRRYQYAYALFSASGFTEPAQAYALAQQISLVDLSGASFGWLREVISDTAAELYERRNQHSVRRFPVSWMRHELRVRLGTAPPGAQTLDQAGPAPEMATNAPHFRAAAEGIIDDFTAALRARERAELLLGFPAAPFILPLGADDPGRFIQYAENRPAHPVRLRRTGSGSQAEWTLSPWTDPDAYQLAFTLPERIESWISENEERRARRASAIKSDFLSEITIYRRHGGVMRIYQLRYEPSELHRPTS
jgi:Restriction endonuclease